MNEPKTKFEVEELNRKISDGLAQLDCGEGVEGDNAWRETLARRARSIAKGKKVEAMTQTERNLAIKRLIREYTEEHSRTPEAARAALIKEGIYTNDGELMPEFGGPSVKLEQCRSAPASGAIDEEAEACAAKVH